MIEFEVFPSRFTVTGCAIFSQLSAVNVFVAGRAFGAERFEANDRHVLGELPYELTANCLVTSHALEFAMLSAQRKDRLSLVVEFRLFPALLAVARGAVGAKLSGMDVFMASQALALVEIGE